MPSPGVEGHQLVLSASGPVLDILGNQSKYLQRIAWQYLAIKGRRHTQRVMCRCLLYLDCPREGSVNSCTHRSHECTQAQSLAYPRQTLGTGATQTTPRAPGPRMLGHVVLGNSTPLCPVNSNSRMFRWLLGM